MFILLITILSDFKTDLAPLRSVLKQKMGIEIAVHRNFLLVYYILIISTTLYWDIPGINYSYYNHVSIYITCKDCYLNANAVSIFKGFIAIDQIFSPFLLSGDFE